MPTGLFFVVCELQSALALRRAWPQPTESSWSLHRAAVSLPSTYAPTRAPLWRRLQCTLCPRPTLRHVLPSGGDYSGLRLYARSLCAAHTVFKDIKKRCLAAAAFTLLVSRAFFRAVVTPDRSFHQAHAVRHVSKRTFWRHYKARFFTHVALLAFHWNGMKSKYSSSVTLTLMQSN